MSRPFRGNAHRKMQEMNEWTKKRQEPALEHDLPIIDPHHHLWDSEERGGRYLMHELAEDTATGGHNVVATVYIDAGQMYRAEGPEEMKAVGEVEFVNGVAAM
ncbi:MAG TPA: amidohydrolase, partial [Burkholderiales bacterium]|nr:amidohydrolase [Burkholderiales bacterium]